jgi:hypothetical protein
MGLPLQVAHPGRGRGIQGDPGGGGLDLGRGWGGGPDPAMLHGEKLERSTSFTRLRPGHAWGEACIRALCHPCRLPKPYFLPHHARGPGAAVLACPTLRGRTLWPLGAGPKAAPRPHLGPARRAREDGCQPAVLSGLELPQASCPRPALALPSPCPRPALAKSRPLALHTPHST